jgi:DNA-binding FadR family transcriptional regulator
VTLVAQRVRIPKTAEVVAAQLRRKIILGHLKDGDLLPPEGVLLQQFGVSRPTFREALRILEAESLIEIRRGARGGCRINTPNVRVAARQVGLLLQFGGATLGDIYRARQVIEPAAAGMLAERPNRAAISTLTEIHDRAEKALRSGDLEAIPQMTVEFHEKVVELSGNLTLALFVDMLHDIVSLHVETVAQRGVPQPAMRAEAEQRAHSRLLAEIKAGDVAAAATHWRAHMDAAARYLFQDSEGKRLIDLLG